MVAERKPGITTKRPASGGTNRAPNRPKRVPMGTHRDILTVDGLDKENYKHRWVLDAGERGQRILRYELAGYSLCPADGLSIGEAMVYKSESEGSIVRVPNGKSGEYLYLMRISREWYDGDQDAKEENRVDVEKQVSRASGEDGQYGKTKLSSDFS